MNFASDNTSGVCPEVIDALAAEAGGSATSYGGDDLTKGLDALFSDLFETQVKAYPVASGTAANAIALASMLNPWGRVLCHHNAHINRDELNAPAALAGGATVETVNSLDGKLTPDLIAPVIGAVQHDVHSSPLEVVSITQATEVGTVYTPDEVAALAEAIGPVPLHMDGARFANAVASLGVAPADITWRAGVNVLCFGATKNGAMDAEAVLFFDGKPNERFERHRKRSGHLLSKMRYVSAQLHALVKDDVWLKNAGHANAMAARIGQAFANAEGATLLIEPAANEVFVSLEPEVEEKLRQAGANFFSFTIAGLPVSRFVANFSTSEAELSALEAALGG